LPQIAPPATILGVMTQRDQPGTVARSPRAPGRNPAWLLALAGLLAWQAWMTLGLYGPAPWQRLCDDEPILSGRHPLHLYHGFLGARALWERGTLSCYDPSFCAGYPKTPVFDGGSRPAELALALAGARFSPAAYKIGHAALCLLAPLLLFLAARGAGLTRGVAVLATALGQLVWWGRPGREALEAGDSDLLLATLMALAQAGLLLRYHQRPCPLSLLGVVLTGFVGWFAHPLLLALLLPLFLVYYLSAGIRHRLIWHVPLLAGLLVAVAANFFWLFDWVGYWWIRVPPQLEAPLLANLGVQSFWEAPLWGEGLDKALACVLLLAGAAGIVLFYLSRKRAAARLLGPSCLGFFLLALAGTAWELPGRLGGCQLLVPALLYATIPAGLALASVLEGLRRWTGSFAAPLLVSAGVPALVWLACPVEAVAWAQRLARVEPLEIGLGEDRLALISALAEQTNDQARILWEDRRGPRRGSRWTALLPILSDRAFVGGLDAEGGIEHAANGLVDEQLAGRPLEEWTDAELDDYCRRYNIGWVVCWSDGTCKRFSRWSPAGTGKPLPQTEEGQPRLFTVDRRPSFALTGGSVAWRSADARRILLADAVPEQSGEDGQIVLSLHYQAGMRVSPSRVRLEQAVDPQDTIPFVRLRMSEPVGRIMITWDGR
jgi:hypothetical protein